MSPKSARASAARASPQDTPCSSGNCRLWHRRTEQSVELVHSLSRELLDARKHDRLGLGGVAPALGLDPLAGLEILVVLEEVLDLLARELRDVVDVLDVRPARVRGGHGDDLRV